MNNVLEGAGFGSTITIRLGDDRRSAAPAVLPAALPAVLPGALLRALLRALQRALRTHDGVRAVVHGPDASIRCGARRRLSACLGAQLRLGHAP